MFRLHSIDLLSKWGFRDGDLFWDYCYDLEQQRIKVKSHDLLIAAVRRWLLPALDQEVETAEIISIHNPIRARSVAGVSVEGFWYDIEPPRLVTPEWVDVPEAEVRLLALEIASR